MKRLTLSIIFIVPFISFFLTGCGNPILGKWQFKEANFETRRNNEFVSEDDMLRGGIDELSITFKNAGKATLNVIQPKESVHFPFDYVYKGEALRISITLGKHDRAGAWVTLPCKLDGDKLVLESDLDDILKTVIRELDLPRDLATDIQNDADFPRSMKVEFRRSTGELSSEQVAARNEKREAGRRATEANRNRDAITADLAHLAAKAQMYYKKPTTMGGGGNDFDGFTLGALDASNTNGEYRVTTVAPRSAVPEAPPGDRLRQIRQHSNTIYLIGIGRVVGRDGTNLVTVYTSVTAMSVTTTVLN